MIQRWLLASLQGMLFIASATASTAVSGSVEGTWTTAGSPYVCATTDIIVAAGHTLTIQPGVVVQFGSGRRMQVGGALSAAGTANLPIIFTSTSASPSAGSWKQIQFLNSATAILEYVEVRWAGQGTGIAALQCGTSVAPTGALNVVVRNTLVADCSNFGFVVSTDQQTGHTVALNNCTVIGGGKGGVDVQAASSADALSITGNDFSAAGGPVVQIKAQALLAFSATEASFTGNVPGDVFTLSAFQTFSKSVTLWHDLTVAAGSGGGPSVAPGVILTVKPGVTLRFGSGQALKVSGTLVAAGTQAKPATFSGVSTTPGAWNGIWLQPGSSGTLDYVAVTFAGNGGYSAILADGASLALTHSEVGQCTHHAVEWQNTDIVNRPLTVLGCSIHNASSGDPLNPAAGIRLIVMIAGDTVRLTGNTFADNDLAISMEPSVLPAFNPGPDAVAGNAPDDTVFVNGGAIPNGTVLWEKANVMSDLSVPVGAVVTLEGGSGLRMGSGAALNVSGTLNVVGQPGRIVTLGGSAATPGDWSGLRFAPGSAGSLTSTIVADAGYGGSANLSVNGATVTATGCAFLNGSGPGVSMSGTVDLSIAGCLIQGNQGPGILDTASGNRTVGNTATTGNDIVANGTPADSAANDWQEARFNYWGAETGPYHPLENPTGTAAPVTDHIHFVPFSATALTLPMARLEPLSVPALGIVPVYGQVGSALLDRWTLEYGQGDPPAFYLPLAQGNGGIPPGLVAEWDTAGLDHLIRYSVRLKVMDVLGRSTQSVVVTRSPYGDITGNGLVEVADGVVLAQFAFGKGTPTPGQMQTGDVRPTPTPDGVLTVADAVAILKTAAGLYGTLP